MPHLRPTDAKDAIAQLKEGNARFVSGAPRSPLPPAERMALAKGQAPFAVVLACSDSRVPVEAIFDQPPGSLFVVRLAGNIVTAEGLGSFEYAIGVLGVSLGVVLGHSGCGAVTAALDFVRSRTPLDGNIQTLIEAIAPAAETALSAADPLAAAIDANVDLGLLQLTQRSPVIDSAVHAGRFAIAAATYDLASGHVRFQD